MFQGLAAMFQEDDLTTCFFNSCHKIDAKIIVAISFLWSLYSFTYSSVIGLTGHRDYFPISSKIVLLASVLCATLNRVITTTIFFTPPLGLFDILRHYQGTNILLKIKITSWRAMHGKNIYLCTMWSVNGTATKID